MFEDPLIRDLDAYGSLDEPTKDQIWNRIREFFPQSYFDGVSVADLSHRCKGDWPNGNPPDLQLNDFTSYSRSEIVSRGLLEPESFLALLKLLRFGIEKMCLSLTTGDPETEPAQLVGADIRGWNRYPVWIGYYSPSTISLCEREGIETFAELCRFCHDGGLEKIDVSRPSGEETATELSETFAAWSTSDLAGMQEWVPLDNTMRFSLLRSIVGVLDKNDDRKLLISRRLLRGMSHEEAAVGISAAALRQQESRFLDRTADCLEWFPRQRDSLFKAWSERRTLKTDNDLGDDDRKLAYAAISTVFKNSPEGQRALNREASQIDGLVEKICDQWAFYLGDLKLRSFLRERQAHSLHEDVKKEGESRGLWSVKSNGKLKPLNVPQKRAAIACLRSMGGSEVKADTWRNRLIACRELKNLDFAQLRRLYNSWKRNDDFPAKTVNFKTAKR